VASPLDNVAWSALNARQSPFALIEGRARRFDPVFGAFAAVADASEASLSDLTALIAAHGDAVLVEADPAADLPGVAVTSEDILVQMTAQALTDGRTPDFSIEPLTGADAAEMLALATLTKPGPFFARTNELGDFVGVKIGGRLAAMAGERMKPHAFTEVSGVCTHPDYRGRGYAGALMRIVAGRIIARGETPFLHAYASNQGAVGLYESLGFSVRREMLMRRVTRPAVD
jgi:predicted GNAT family acetyltransferase